MDDAKILQETEEGVSKAPSEARIVSDKPRSKDVPIDYPVEFDGKVWESIPMERSSGDQVAEYWEALREGKELVPVGIKVPIEVWRKMDDDDRWRVEGIYDDDFFPQRLKDMGARIQETIEDTPA